MATKHVGCVEDGCENKHTARGYCAKHYSYRKWRGEFTKLRPKGPDAGHFGCLALDCEGDYYATGYCQYHYNVFLRHGPSLCHPKKLLD